MDERRTRTDGDVPTSPLEIVTARVEEMVTEAEQLRAVINASRTTSRRFYATMAALMLILGALGVFTVGNREISRDNQELNRRSIEILARLDSCLIESKDPRSCYARQQERTADLLGEPAGPINTVTILTAVCTRIYLDRPAVDVDDGKKRIVSCVEAELKRRDAAKE